MAFKVGIGKSDFEEMRKNNNYYVDKTNIIYELVEETDSKVTLFTRPRRFGKTLMMSMLWNFFSIRKDSRDIFQGLQITEHKEFCERWMNQYPVLFVSLKDIEADDFAGAYDMLIYRLSEVCIGLSDMVDSDRIDMADREVFARLKAKSAKANEVKNALKTIMRMMHAVYSRKVILLIDEYDVPLAGANEKNREDNEYFSSMLEVMRGILGTALKDNEFLEFAVITGCLRVAKSSRGRLLESIFTGTNNFASFSVLDQDFSGYFGFSEEEVEEMLSAAHRQDKAEAGRILSDLLWYTISYNDCHEDYYHAFLAGIFVGRGYHVESNKEKGLGRPDILLKDKRNRRAIIIESKKESHMDRDCREAIDQIVAEKYAEGLYGYNQILCYGVAFFQKQAKVKKLQKV